MYDDLDDPRDVLCDSDEPVRTLSVAVTPTLAARAIAYARARGLDLDDVVAEALDALVGAPG